MAKPDITKSLISDEDIQTLLLTFVPDSLIVSRQFEIVAVDTHLAKMLGCKPRDLQGQPIESISYKTSLVKTLAKELTSGFFDSTRVLLKGKKNILDCNISGFYLGLIAELNDKILLKVKIRNQVLHLNNQLAKSRDELDEFVYRTAHDLRGPVSTIRGLINLMKLENPDGEMSKLVAMSEMQANKLDDRLFNLHYLSEFAFSQSTDNNLDCAALESKLRGTIEENIAIDHIDFQFLNAKRFIKGVNAQLVSSMINHLFLYLLNLPNNSAVKLVVRVTEAKNDALNVTISSEGFLSDYQLREVINQKTPLYTNIVAYSKLINFFAAQKAAQRVNAMVKIDFIREIHQQISIRVPFT